ncbi:lipopolysaccharide biosynthesis protein [Nocardioides donggukensis]|uniref:Polysaccharide biosynthesis protein n=1 Tax=Nocardioides donggukensis TaxID=2774019 RepID=A0A927PZM0_9ACTN|nr:hypothetical protein [Nocardioides donggukensis]MBD8869385.1 hypothetical protein [Nocardioides donggukensis]
MSAVTREVPRRILRPFLSLVSGQVIGTALGFAFWVLTARTVPVETVGVAAAAITAQPLLGKLATLGTGNHLIAELPLLRGSAQRHLLRAAAGTVAGAALVVGAVAALIAGLASDHLREGLGGALPVGTFLLGVVATSLGFMVDKAVLGLDRSDLQVLRNLVAAGLRLPLTAGLLTAGLTSAPTLLLAWVLPLAVGLVVVGVRLGRLTRDPDPVPRPRWREQVSRHGAGALRNHALDLSLAASPLLVPVVAAMTLPARANAEFTVAWLIATFVFIPPYMLATALFAASVNRTLEDFLGRMRTTLPAALGVSAALCVAAWVAGEQLLRVFGSEYAEQSARLLSLLVVAGLWMVVKDHLVVMCRVERRFDVITRLAGGAVLLELLGATLGAAVGGVTGLCVGWLLAQALEVYAIAPVLAGMAVSVVDPPGRESPGEADVEERRETAAPSMEEVT